MGPWMKNKAVRKSEKVKCLWQFGVRISHHFVYSIVLRLHRQKVTKRLTIFMCAQGLYNVHMRIVSISRHHYCLMLMQALNAGMLAEPHHNYKYLSNNTILIELNKYMYEIYSAIASIQNDIHYSFQSMLRMAHREFIFQEQIVSNFQSENYYLLNYIYIFCWMSLSCEHESTLATIPALTFDYFSFRHSTYSYFTHAVTCRRIEFLC